MPYFNNPRIFSSIFLGVPLRKNYGSGVPLQVLAKFRFRYTSLWAFRFTPSRKTRFQISIFRLLQKFTNSKPHLPRPEVH